MQEIFWNEHAGTSLGIPQSGFHLWELRPSPAYSDLLSSGESLRWRQMASEEARMSFAASQGGLRKIASRYLNCDPAQIVLNRAERGKPYIANGPEFNLSHTTGRIFAAFSSQPLGLDVESTERRVHARELAAKFFFPREAAHVNSLDDAQGRIAFLRYWVCKEATVKLSGDGIYHGLREARVELGEGGVSHGTYRGKEVWLKEFYPGGNLLAALASWEPVEAKGFFRI